MPKSKAKYVKIWKEARLLQQIMFVRLGDREWDVWDNSKGNILLHKIGFGLYCLPESSREWDDPENSLPDNSPEYDNLENSLPGNSRKCDKPENSLPDISPENDNPVNKLPEKSPECDNPTGYSQEQFNIIKSVADVILSSAMGASILHFATIFVFGKIEERRFQVPVFKVKGKKNQTLFVDSESRVYENWQHYLNSNNLPKCMYCYPRDGLYQGDMDQVLVDFGKSPACRKNTNVSNNNPATKVSFTPTSDMVISSVIDYLIFFEEMTQETEAPVATVRHRKRNARVDLLSLSIENLINRYLDGKSIGLEDSEARMAWDLIANFVLEFVQNTMYESITRNAADGEVVDSRLKTIYDIVNFGSGTVNFLGIMCCLFSLVDKADKCSLDSCDISVLTPITLFFSNMNLRKGTAEEIIASAQQQVLRDHCDDLSEPQLEACSRLMKQVPGEAPLQRNANKIKAIKDLRDKNDFYDCLVKAKSDLEGHQVQYSLEEPGVININNELNIGPNKLVEINEEERKMILDATKEIKDGKVNHNRWNRIERILQDGRIIMEFQRRKDIIELKTAFKVENLKTVQIGNVKIFEKMKPWELDRLSNTVKSLGKKKNHEILEIAAEFAKQRQCENLTDYISYLQVTTTYLNNLKHQEEVEFDKEAESKGFTHPKEKNKFAKMKGINEKRSLYFLNKVLDSFWTEHVSSGDIFYTFHQDSFDGLMQYYTSVEVKVEAIESNENFKTKFTSTPNKVYHYIKHSDFPNGKLTVKEYFDLASELVEEPLNQLEEQLNQQGNLTMITFTNPKNGARGVVYETLADGKRSLATLFYDKKVLKDFDQK